MGSIWNGLWIHRKRISWSMANGAMGNIGHNGLLRLSIGVLQSNQKLHIASSYITSILRFSTLQQRASQAELGGHGLRALEARIPPLTEIEHHIYHSSNFITYPYLPHNIVEEKNYFTGLHACDVVPRT